MYSQLLDFNVRTFIKLLICSLLGKGNKSTSGYVVSIVMYSTHIFKIIFKGLNC